MSTFERLSHSLLIFASSVLLLAATALMSTAWSATLEPGHSAMWFNPDRDGEGWVLEVLDDERALIYWYTYDSQGNQRWLHGVGTRLSDASGDELVFPELMTTRGGRFGPGFDPDQVEREVVGEAVLRFSDCNQGQFSYVAFDQAQTIDIQRLSQTMAAGCEPVNGVPGKPVRDYAGQSGSWFDPERDGEGFTLHWLSNDQALLAWFTYDDQGMQRWLTGVGDYQDGQIVVPTLQATRGAQFGEAFDPDDVERLDFGSMTLDLSCSSGTANYAANQTMAQIMPPTEPYNLSRLTSIAGLPCPWVAPQLSELYALSWQEITLPDSGMIYADSIADDGTIAGVERSDTLTGAPRNMTLWRPESQDWQRIPDEIDGQVWISPDGLSVLSGLRIGFEYYPAIWRQDSGWQRLPGLDFDDSLVLGISHDFSQVVGVARDAGDINDVPWIWSADEGQQRLPLSDQAAAAVPIGVANDGNHIVGRDALATIGFSFGLGLEWTDGQSPTALLNEQGQGLGGAFLCNQDCSVIAGTGLAGLFSPERRAWVRTREGTFFYLDGLDTAPASGTIYWPRAMSADGSLIVGIYQYSDDDPPENLGSLIQRAFVWTQRTGTVSLSELLEASGIIDDQWRIVSAQSVSSSGDKVLISAWPSVSPADATQVRALVLELSPQAQD